MTRRRLHGRVSYLSRVTTRLDDYKAFLTALGVRDGFDAQDFVHANACFVRDAKEQALSPERLTACVATLEAASASAAASEEGATHLGSFNLFLPGEDAVLRPAPELTFDDAPWMSATIRQRPDGGSVRFVHSSVPTTLAERCGARSLRYLLLLEEKLTDQLPCPSAEQIAAPSARRARGAPSP